MPQSQPPAKQPGQQRDPLLDPRDPKSVPLESPMPRSPVLDQEEPDFANEPDLPKPEDGDRPGRGEGQRGGR